MPSPETRKVTWRRDDQLSEARASLAALDAEPEGSAEIGNARAAICLAEGNPAAVLAAVQDVGNGIAPATGYVTVVAAHLLAALAHRELGDHRAATAAAPRGRFMKRGATQSSRWTVPGSKAGTQTEMYSAPSVPGLL